MYYNVIYLNVVHDPYTEGKVGVFIDTVLSGAERTIKSATLVTGPLKGGCTD